MCLDVLLIHLNIFYNCFLQLHCLSFFFDVVWLFRIVLLRPLIICLKLVIHPKPTFMVFPLIILSWKIYYVCFITSLARFFARLSTTKLEEQYAGLTANTFKTRYANHKTSQKKAIKPVFHFIHLVTYIVAFSFLSKCWENKEIHTQPHAAFLLQICT